MIDPEIQGIEDEIAELETRLAAAKARLLSNGGNVKRPIEPTPMVTDCKQFVQFAYTGC